MVHKHHVFSVSLEVFTLLFKNQMFRLINALSYADTLLLDLLASNVILGIPTSEVIFNMLLGVAAFLVEFAAIFFLLPPEALLVILLHLGLAFLLGLHVLDEALLLSGLTDLPGHAFLVRLELPQACLHPQHLQTLLLLLDFRFHDSDIGT
jgi:hypothetical protein